MTDEEREVPQTPTEGDANATNEANKSNESNKSNEANKLNEANGTNINEVSETVPTEEVPAAPESGEVPPTDPVPPPTDPNSGDRARYDFSWDYRSQSAGWKKEAKTVRVRAGLFYGLVVGAMFLTLLVLLLVVLLIGEQRAAFPLGGGSVAGLTERVVYVKGDGDTEEALAVEAAVAKMLPSSVSIHVSRLAGVGVGSGVVLSEDGYIATNHHVIDDATSISVRLYGGTRYSATVIAADETADLAVLKIEATGLTPATFADSDALVVGETVMAIGAPTGISYSETVTRGIVSSAGRAVQVYNEEGTHEYTLVMVQTDASVNPGNSGGPLINRNGEVIGIVTNKVVFYEEGATVFADGMGLAIPANAAKAILEDLKAQRQPDYDGFYYPAARLGISGKNVSESGFYMRTGILVTEFTSPRFDAAEKLKKNDIILSIDGSRTENIQTMQMILEEYLAGATVRLTVFRKGAEITVDVVLGSDELVG